MILDNLKMLEGIFNCFHFLHRRMLPRLLQFLHCIRSIIHRQAQISFYLCDICGMYFETVFSFYVLLYHFVGHSFFGLIAFGSFSDIIKRNFSLTLTKLNFYIDMSVWLFVESSTTVSTCVPNQNISPQNCGNIGNIYTVLILLVHSFSHKYCFLHQSSFHQFSSHLI